MGVLSLVDAQCMLGRLDNLFAVEDVCTLDCQFQGLTAPEPCRRGDNLN